MDAQQGNQPLLKAKQRWLGKLFNPSDPTTDVKLVAFMSVVIFAIAKLSYSNITSDWVNAFFGLCALVGLGGTAWAAVDKWKGGKTDASQQGSTRDDGGQAP